MLNEMSSVQNIFPKFTVLLFVSLSISACAHKKAHTRLPPVAAPSSYSSYSVEELLIQHEGLQLRPYMDASNKLTIGVGRNLDDTGITRDEALLLLHNDIDRITQQLDVSLPWWRSLSVTRQNVLISMAFNLGVQGLLGFTRMLSYLQDGDYSGAAEEMLSSKWATQVGNRAVELAGMMENG
jgi:lysozyme